jgi:hypothetical protein
VLDMDDIRLDTSEHLAAAAKQSAHLERLLVVLESGSLVIQSDLQEVRRLFSLGLFQLLEEYNRRRANNPPQSVNSLRQALILKVKLDIQACVVAADQDSNAQAPRPTTTEVRRATSEKRIIANRQNSLRSTGPRTAQGKQVVRKNAITHGLLSDPIIALSPEELAEFQTLHSKLLTRIGPRNEVKARLIGNVTVLIWRLNRCIRAQGSLLSTTGPNDRWRTLHRYAGSLNRQLREKISDLYVLRNPKKGAMYVR